MTPVSPSSSRSNTPAIGTSTTAVGTSESTSSPELRTVVVGEQLQSDYLVHELPPVSDFPRKASSESQLLDRALLARIEMLEAENSHLQKAKNEKHYFWIEDIQHNDKLVHFYTGFVSYALFLAFLSF